MNNIPPQSEFRWDILKKDSEGSVKTLNQEEIFKKFKDEINSGKHLDSKTIKILNNENLRYKICKIMGVRFNESISILNGNFSDPTIIIKVVKFNLKNHFESFSINNYKLDSLQRFEIAKFAAKSKDRISNQIKEYNLNPQQCFEVAKIAITARDSNVSPNIKEYNLNPEQLFEIAKIAASKKSSNISLYIQNYGLSSEQRFEIAKMAVMNDVSFYQHIKKYDLNQEQRFEIAKMVANLKNMYFPQFIQNFELNEDQRFEVARVHASSEASSISNYIKKYKLNPEQRFEIAKIAAIKDSNISIYIQNYELSQEQNFEIAKIAANKNSYISIENYELNPEQRFEIAKINAAVENSDIFQNIEDFELTPEELFQIAKIVASAVNANICEFIQFSELSQEQRVEVAKIAAKSGNNIFKNFKVFNIIQNEQILELAKLNINSNPKYIYDILKYNFDGKIIIFLLTTFVTSRPLIFDDSSPWPSIIKKINAIPIRKNYQESKEKLIFLENELKNAVEKNKVLSELVQQLLTCCDLSSNFDSLLVQQRFLSWVTRVTALCSEYKIPFSEMKLLLPILKNLAVLPDPVLREKLSFNLMAKFNYPMTSELRRCLVELSGIQEGKQCPLFAMLLAPLALAGEQETCEKFISTFYSNKKQSSSGPHQKTMLELLFLLNETNWNYKEQSLFLKKLIDEIVSPKNKVQPIFRGLSKKARGEALKQKAIERQLPNRTFKEMMNSAQIARDLLLMGKESSLKDISSRKDINALMEDIYIEVLGGEKSDTFTEKYVNSFGKFRDRQALWTYYAKLQTLLSPIKEETLYWFKIYTQSVLDGTFKEQRYLENIHFKTLFQHRSDLIEVWKQGEMKTPEQLVMTESSTSTAEDIDSIFSHVKEAILQHKHLGDNVADEYPYIVKYLENPQNRKEILKIIDSEREKFLTLNQEKGADKKNNNKILANLRFQKCFLEMFDPQVKIETKIKEVFRIALESEFKNDLKALNLKEAPVVSEGLIVADTDDPCDFLLMGSVMEGGSCQSVNADPKISRGLLGTMLNGQNRMIAVKSDGNILARALIRLLWDNQKKCPVLYLEPIYFRLSDPKFNEMIIEMAKNRAKKLNLDLVRSYQSNETVYPNAIHSLKGQCPFEYSDAFGGDITSSTFSIQKSSFLLSTGSGK